MTERGSGWGCRESGVVQAEGQLGGEAGWEREAGPSLWARKAVLAV